MLKKSLDEGTVEFKIFKDAKENKLDILVIFTALFTLLTTYAYGIYRKLRYDRTLAYLLVGIYSVFALYATYVASKKAYNFWDCF